MKKFLAVLLIVFFASISLGFEIQRSVFPPRHEVIEIYEVKNGDTLWGICSYYCKKDCRRIYICQMIEEVESLNPYLKDRDGLVLTGDKIKIRYMELDK